MTTREKVIKQLEDNGMFLEQAEQVFKKAQPLLKRDDYTITWDRPASEYPEPFYNVLWVMIKPIALQWIDENCPQAWFRPMFA